jgi:hypothetical protein
MIEKRLIPTSQFHVAERMNSGGFFITANSSNELNYRVFGRSFMSSDTGGGFHEIRGEWYE